MNTQTIARNSIPYNNFKRFYGVMIDTKLLDMAIAFHFVDGVKLDREEVIKLQREIGDSLNTPVGYTKLFNWIITRLAETYPEIEPMQSVKFNYKVVKHFVLNELVFRQFITKEQKEFVEKSIENYEFLDNYTWLHKLCVAICHFSDDTLTYLGLGLSEDELRDIIHTTDDMITFKHRKDLDQTSFWHLMGVLEKNGGYR